MSPIIPPPEAKNPRVTTTVRLRRSLLAEIDALAQDTERNRTEVIEFLLAWAAVEARREIEAQRRLDQHEGEGNQKKK